MATHIALDWRACGGQGRLAAMTYRAALCLLLLLAHTAAAQDGPAVITMESSSAQAENQQHLAAGCTDMTQCTRQELNRGSLCNASDSLAVKVTNHCKEAVALNVCMERSDGTWECAMQKRVKVGRHDTNAFHTCHGTGRYRVLATRADAKAAACFKGGKGDAAAPEAPEADPAPSSGGVCAAAKACCNALVAVPGMEALGAACAQLAPITEEQGGATCDYILKFMKQQARQMPKVPPACQ